MTAIVTCLHASSVPTPALRADTFPEVADSRYRVCVVQRGVRENKRARRSREASLHMADAETCAIRLRAALPGVWQAKNIFLRLQGLA